MTYPPEHRLLTLSDVEEAAQVISQAFMDDPLISFMLPIKATRIKTLVKFFCVYGEISIKNNRGYGVGEPLQGWHIGSFQSRTLCQSVLSLWGNFYLSYSPCTQSDISGRGPF